MNIITVAREIESRLPGMLEHVHLLAAKRLSDSGRRRLDVLQAQLRLLTALLEHGNARLCHVARPAMVDVRIVVHSVVVELDAVLADEASRPY